MAVNPLQKFFRQPKIYIKLPSKGVYNQPGVIQGDITSLPVYGMTGMDEIIMKTPDALLSGESTVKIIESCCPWIKDGWDISALDLDVVLTAIRIATYGNTTPISNTCPNCETENQYDVDLSFVIEHFSKCNYENKIVLKDMVIVTQPLTYKQNTEFSLQNFKIQQQLKQVDSIEDAEEQKKVVASLFQELSKIQVEIFKASIEAVEVNGQVVNEKSFISEWLTNCDKSIFDSLKTQYAANKDSWQIPKYTAKCENCDHESPIILDLDHSNFFGNA